MTEQMKNAITAFTTELEKSEELAAYRAAKAKYDADSELKALINEYNVQAAVLEQEGKKSEAERDKTLIDSVSARLRAVYDEIGRSETLAEMREEGVNDSMVHVDFMVGAQDLCITGYKDGKATPVFINGSWAPGFE